MSDRHKLDPVLLEQIERAAESSEEEKRVDVILSLASAADDEALSALAALGFSSSSVIGEIVTGDIPSEQLRALSAHPSVVKVEGASPLSTERPFRY